jgi:hypothetical protein
MTMHMLVRDSPSVIYEPQGVARTHRWCGDDHDFRDSYRRMNPMAGRALDRMHLCETPVLSEDGHTQQDHSSEQGESSRRPTADDIETFTQVCINPTRDPWAFGCCLPLFPFLPLNLQSQMATSGQRR